MSKINTSGIDITYPVPGKNNSTQGFRDNFTSIKNNLDTASTELSDLQGKAVLKSGLTGVTINNDMANTLITNASIKGFRTPTFNMGGSLPMAPDIVVIDVTKGDVQYASIQGDTKILFAGWSPTGTQCSIDLHLFVANNTATLNFPDTNYGINGLIESGSSATVRQLENYFSTLANGAPITVSAQSDFSNLPANARTITNSVFFPNGVKEVKYKFVTRDCGQNIDILSLNRTSKASQIELKWNVELNAGLGVVGTDVPSTNDINNGFGREGDTAGAISTDGNYLYVCTGDYTEDGFDAIYMTENQRYKIISVGDTDFTTIGSANNNVGTVFTCAGISSYVSGGGSGGVEGKVRPAIWKYVPLSFFGHNVVTTPAT